MATLRLTRAAWRALPYTENPLAWRRLAAATLLQACTDAHAGDHHAADWLHSHQAHEWAGLVDLPDWPPRLDQLDNRTRLQARARELLRA